MEIKILEVRDRGTFIPIIAVNMQPDNDIQRYFLADRCGYPCDGRPNIAISRLSADGSPFTNDPYWWTGLARTMPVAHQYIYEHWPELADGDVVDVEFILGETATRKVSERITQGP